MSKNTAPFIGKRSRIIVDFIYDVYRQGILGYFENSWYEHGDLVQFKIGSQHMFLVANPKHIRHILISNRQKYDKLGSYKGVRKLLLGNGLFTSNGAEWKRQRRLISPSFSPKNIQQFGPVVANSCTEFLARWNTLSEQGKPVEIIDEMMRLSSTIILKATFSLNMTQEALDMQEDVETMFRFSTLHEMNPLSLPLWFPSKNNRSYFRAREKVDSFILRTISARRAQNVNLWPDDFLTKLMIAKDKETGQPMSNEMLRDELITIFFAGHETTARTLAFLWYGVSQHPEIEKELHKEVDANSGNNLNPDRFEVGRMDYTSRLIKETLRLYSAAPVYIRDVKYKDNIDGVEIPEDATMMIFPYLTHRHKDYWDDPLKFNPDRWLPEFEMKREPDTFFPFGLGKRTCVGNHLALYETQIIVTELARHFILRTVPGHQPKFEMEGTLISKNGLPMVIERRNKNIPLQDDFGSTLEA